MEIALIDWISQGLDWKNKCAVSYRTFVKLSFTRDRNRVDCEGIYSLSIIGMIKVWALRF